ncbi:MAG TPA: DegT/DnrJ/EryC1/StrS family aminotransferase [Steroidobacteraceae bacterium]|nr:DegT/DnrJ/EryC1/StrS family aminotransferase [Steroidobacteraceae bacterium]
MSDHLPFARPTIDEKSIEDVAQVLRSGWIASGPYVTKFESALSTYLGGREVRTVTSGTAALEIALRAAGVREGDGVIVPAMSFAASANVVMRVGAIPVFVDVELRSRNLDLALVPAAISPRVRAIMPVHFAGLPVDQERLYDIAAKHGVRVIEDAAHAIGSTYRGRRIGSFGDVACFSFHPNKNLTTIEGGAIAFGSGVDVDLIELERFHGIIRDGEGNVDVVRAGGKYNLSDVAARLGLAQLERLDGFTARRRELASLYFDELGIDPPGVLPERGDSGHCWNMFTLLLPFDQLGMTRAQFQHAMGQRGIGVGVHYPCIPSLTAYRNLSDRSAHRYPNAARIGRETVTLPLFPTMADSDVRRVCEALRAVLAHRT